MADSDYSMQISRGESRRPAHHPTEQGHAHGPYEGEVGPPTPISSQQTMTRPQRVEAEPDRAHRMLYSKMRLGRTMRTIHSRRMKGHAHR